MVNCTDVQKKRINKMTRGGKRENKYRGISGRGIVKKDIM